MMRGDVVVRTGRDEARGSEKIRLKCATIYEARAAVADYMTWPSTLRALPLNPHNTTGSIYLYHNNETLCENISYYNCIEAA